MLKFTARKDRVIFSGIAYPFITLASLICIIPFIVILSSSLTQEKSIIMDGYSIFPRAFSLEAYKTLFENPDQVLKAYRITIYTTLTGGLIGLFLTAMTAFVLSVKSFPWRNKFTFFFYFTTLFSGGLVPWYILCVQYLRFKQNPLIALVLPYLFNIFYLLIMKTFLKTTIPDAIIESAKMDGAGYFRIFIRLVLPLSKPALATIGLFMALNYWNDWYLSFLFATKPEYYSLQYFVYKMISMEDAIKNIAASANVKVPQMPKEGIRMAMTVIATGPIILLYPFVQKYFVKGLTIGAVKG